MATNYNMETALDIAEKLLEQEHIINMKRMAILSKMMIKLAENHNRIRDILEPELTELVKLEKDISALESVGISVLSQS